MGFRPEKTAPFAPSGTHEKMKNTKINICSLGDPKDPKVWSGTPNNIYRELLKRDACGDAFNAEGPRWILYTVWPYAAIYGYEHSRKGLWRRYICSQYVAARTAKSPTKHTLHMGVNMLPFFRRPADQFHYILCDTTWDIYLRYSTEIGDAFRKKYEGFEDLEKRAYRDAQHIFPISEHVKENLVSHYGIPEQKITVVRTGLGVIKPFSGEKDYTEHRILFTAKARFKDKGGELVVAAFREAVKADPALRLTIVGNDESVKYRDCPNITTLGFVPLAKLQELFDTHSLFMMPAIYEPWGLVYLEAMSCKMPIMGLNRNSFPELSGYGQYGFAIDEPDPKAIAKTIVDIFSDCTRLKQMGESAQSHVLSNYTWEKSVDDICRVVEKVQAG